MHVETKIGRVLHVGCGGRSLPSWLEGMQEVRLDIEPDCRPDIVASAVDLGEIGEFECIYSSHVLEHLYMHELPVALAEFRRVLIEGGRVITIVPDIEGVQPNNEVLFESSGGPITGLDMFYGMGRLVEEFPHMAHHNCFTSETLKQAFMAAGYSGMETRKLPPYNIIGVAIK